MSNKYQSPHDWLYQHLDSLDLSSEQGVTRLYKIVASLVPLVESDQIQDEFQLDMEQDGYFDDTDERES